MRVPAAEGLVVDRVDALGQALPAATEGDVSALHRARVASRRLRAVLPVVAPGRKGEELTRQVRRVTQALGPVRELDVALLMLEGFEDDGAVTHSAAQALRATIVEERRRHRAELGRRLKGFDVDRLRKRAAAAARDAVRTGPGMRDPARVAKVQQRAHERADRLVRAMDRAAALYLPDRLHEVRIAVKKLRYTLELEQALGASRATRRIQTLKATQDLLGRIHDLEILIAQTRSAQASPRVPSLKVSAELDRLVRQLESECRRLHGHYMASRSDLLTVCRYVTERKTRLPRRASAA